MATSITTQTLADTISQNHAILVDVRPSAAYNGWRLRGEKRGGHIPGSVSFPVQWFELFSEETIKKILSEKGFLSENLILTGYPDDLDRAASEFNRFGLNAVQVHEKGTLEWASQEDRPLRFLPRYRHLVHVEWLEQLLEGENPDKTDMKPYVLAHVNFDNWGDYDEGHIPGAIWLDTLCLESERTWNRHPAGELEQELADLGITRDTMVVLYGRTANPNMSQDHPGKQAGQLASMRAAMILLYAGVQDVRVLDGGLDSWLRAGHSVTREEVEPRSVSETGLDIPEHPEYIVDTPEAKDLIAGSDSELVSMRSWEEYIGNVSGYHYVGPKGRIKGAVFGNNGSDAYHMENYRNHDDTMRSFHEIEAEWKKMGITPDKRIAFYCGTGWRASEAFFCAWLMGWPNVAVYDGGWFEWSSDPENPVESGIPENMK